LDHKPTSRDAILEFVTKGLRNLGGVDATMTYHAAWSSDKHLIQSSERKEM
jgi:hypothetical protein